MEMEFVTSSNVESIGYDASLNVLHVSFLNGGLYEYHNVPEEVFFAFRSASSKGGYLAANVKNVYPCHKI